jgi:hypothetical protein
VITNLLPANPDAVYTAKKGGTIGNLCLGDPVPGVVIRLIRE